MQTTVAPTPHVRWRGLAITIASLLAIGFATLLPEPGQSMRQHSCLVCGSFGGVDAFLNVLLFLPLGIGLALSGIAGRRALLAVCGLSMVIETAQFLVIPGRDSTLGDVITNTIGGALGFGLVRYSLILLRPTPRIATILTIGWSATWLSIQSISSYGFAPSLPDSRYYGQIARAIGKLALFEGRVISARVDDVAIPNWAFADSRPIRRALLNGAPVVAMVIAAGPTRGMAPIVRVADAEQREIVVLAQQQRNLLFGIRTGADVLRLRRPMFALRNAFPSGDVDDGPIATDVLRLSGRYFAGEVTMSAQTALATRHRREPVTTSLGWTMVLPFNWIIEGTHEEFVVSCIWTASWLIPFGYWAGRMAADSTAAGIARHWRLVFLVLLPVAVGLIMIPRAFGLPAASLSEWLCGLAGLIVGGALATRVTGGNESHQPRSSVAARPAAATSPEAG
ncbi:MAG: VanZ family protein [Anaerolineae bacterium]|nr:VanZ family protein [Gemmatimonadaceae bacterium]